MEQKKIINWVGCLFKLYWGKIKYKKIDERPISIRVVWEGIHQIC